MVWAKHGVREDSKDSFQNSDRRHRSHGKQVPSVLVKTLRHDC